MLDSSVCDLLSSRGSGIWNSWLILYFGSQSPFLCIISAPLSEYRNDLGGCAIKLHFASISLMEMAGCTSSGRNRGIILRSEGMVSLCLRKAVKRRSPLTGPRSRVAREPRGSPV